MTIRPKPAELLVCTCCKNAADPAVTGEAVLSSLSEALAGTITVTGVQCLSNCSRGCTIALRGAGRWTYVYGNIDASAHLEAIRDGAARYVQAPDGLVPWRDRPLHFRKNCIARIPPMETE
ncbi:DUF1636 domain-containing protein [Paracoccus sp. PAR01]|uniref:DUF1636 family protein n=1 Tax=Paracoccus sp. PAR01 TaxID=2769282 RepID=UPI00177A866B|nr:DUF1636 domain-containing protein [Paracoccus sp. PAR01]MBD9529370.1 DUF1636 domain-containing protein [Paracoccus sp. PAR01]